MMDRMISPELDRMDDAGEMDTVIKEEFSLRPKTFDEYIGQSKVKDQLSLAIQASLFRKESLDHVLLSGPPGLGKTTLSHLIANEMGGQLHAVSGPNVDKKGDLAAILTNLQPHDVLFIDEIHRIPKTIEEVLYSAMEDYKLDIIIGQGPAAKTIRIDLPPFTLVGATTRSGLLSNPMRDRFGVSLHLDFYEAEDLKKIVVRSSALLGMQIEDQAALEIARRSRGTPRIANRLLKRVRDFSQVRKVSSLISHEISKEALDLFEVDHLGLDPFDRKYLETLIGKFDGGPVGIETISSALSEERDTLEEVIEPFLLKEGYILRTPRGRVASKASYDHLGFDYQPKAEPTLFEPVS